MPGPPTANIDTAEAEQTTVSDRRNIKIEPDVYNRLADAKRSHDTWSDFFSRLLNSAEGDQVHVNRSTLDEFNTEENTETGVTLQASDSGKLVLEFSTDGKHLGGTTLASLKPNETVEVTASEGQLSPE